ncbi:unnamed protein product, partial [Brenthis ino]
MHTELLISSPNYKAQGITRGVTFQLLFASFQRAPMAQRHAPTVPRAPAGPPPGPAPITSAPTPHDLIIRYLSTSLMHNYTITYKS